jgi:hypothetical protein
VSRDLESKNESNRIGKNVAVAYIPTSKALVTKLLSKRWDHIHEKRPTVPTCKMDEVAMCEFAVLAYFMKSLAADQN